MPIVVSGADYNPEESPYERGRRLVICKMRQNSGMGERYKNCRLRDFKPIPTQAEAFNAACEFCENYISGKNRGEGLLFAGNCGSGKTMLAASLAGEILERGKLDETRVGMAAMYGIDVCGSGPDIVRFVNIVDFLERIRCSFDKSEAGSARSILEEYEKIPLLFIDDLGAERPTGWAGERLYELINYRYMEVLPIIVTTNCNADELRDRLGDRLFDRVKSMCRYVPLTVRESLRKSCGN